MRKKLFILSIISLTYTGKAQNSFPYSNSLQTSSTYTQIQESTGTSLNPLVGAIQTKGVLLTPADTNKYSGIELSGIDFKTDRGFNIDFEYFQWGGVNRADGLALVLFDANTTTPKMGARGAGLGYTYAKYPNKPTDNRDGFTNGYLAFGIDTYGNFHKRRLTNDELRNGASYNSTVSGVTTWKDLITEKGFEALSYSGNSNNPSSSYFTIRGSVNNPKWITGQQNSDNTKGNPLLYVVNTTVSTTGSSNSPINAVSMATTNDGSHGSRYMTDFNPFNIRGGNYTDITTNAAYRKAYIQFRKGVRIYYNTNPVTNPNAVINEEITSYFYDVIIETNTGKYKIAKDEQVRISAKNNQNVVRRVYANPTAVSETSNELLNFYGKAPDRLKMAFTASTGTYYQNQLVRNVNIALPFSPNANTDLFTNVCPDTSSIIGRPLANDTGYIDDVYIQRVVGNASTAAVDLVWLPAIVTNPELDNIDPQSFSFMKLDTTTGRYTKLNTSPNATDDSQHKYTISGVGTFEYIYKNGNTTLNPSESYIKFTPVNGGTAINGTYTLYYTIRNKNTSNLSTNGQRLYDEEYRSSVGTITVEIKKDICGKSHIITNKNVTTVI